MQNARKLAYTDTDDLAGIVGLPGQQPYLITAAAIDGALVVAAVATPGIAYAVYYAALREYLGSGVRLSHGKQTLAASNV